MLRWIERFNTNGADAIFAACQQEPHAIPFIQLPIFFRYSQQPSLWDQSIEKGEHGCAFVGGLRFGKG
jgi:hypothetical protein